MPCGFGRSLMPARQYNIIVAPSDGRKSYHLQLSFRALVAIAVVLVLLGTAGVFLGVTYGSLAYKVRNWEELRERTASLEEEVARYAGFEEEVLRLREMNRQIRQLVGLPEADPGAVASVAHAAEDESERPEGIADISLTAAQVPDEETRLELERQLIDYRHTLSWPVDGFVSSSFGERRSMGGAHSGIDIAAPRHTVIETPLAGKVAAVGWDSVYGKVALIDHGNGLMTVYGHNAELVVREGERIRKGDAIALLGNTGESSAPHLHFEVRKDGFVLDPFFLLKPKQNS